MEIILGAICSGGDSLLHFAKAVASNFWLAGGNKARSEEMLFQKIFRKWIQRYEMLIKSKR